MDQKLAQTVDEMFVPDFGGILSTWMDLPRLKLTLL
jgi:hypothetical protein